MYDDVTQHFRQPLTVRVRLFGTADFLAWFKKVSGTVVRSTLRAVPATVPDTFLNQADFFSFDCWVIPH
jgi:hypothetical protein